MTKVAIAPGDYAGLHKEVVSVVESARLTAARNINAVMTAAYWATGRLRLRKMSGRRLENRCRRKTLSTLRQRRPITWR